MCIDIEIFYNGGGVAIGDVNNDGQQDIYLTSNLNENKLYTLTKGISSLKISTESAKVGGEPKRGLQGYRWSISMGMDFWISMCVIREM